MNEPFDNIPRENEDREHDPKAVKKKNILKNIFYLNLCVTLLLIGIFWLPLKLQGLEEFINSPSVNLPQKGEVNSAKVAPKEKRIEYIDMLPSMVAVINASSEKDWIYFDFSQGKTVNIHDPSSLDWDLAFRRGKVISNGGATNKFGKAGLIDLKVSEFDRVGKVPLENYIQDKPTRTEPENPVLLKWYNYNYFTHKLTAKKNVYAVRTSDSKYAKVQFLSFYCDNKETGCIKMRYSYQDTGSNSFLKPPMGSKAASVAAITKAKES
jgi:hypothetical protein